MERPLNYTGKSPRFSRLVIVALIFAGFSYPFSFFAGLPAMLMAIVATQRIKARPNELTGLGYAYLAGWLAAIGIFFIPAYFVISEYCDPNSHREMARRVKCSVNIRRTMIAMWEYASDNHDQWPIGQPPEKLFTYRMDLGINTDKTANSDALAYMQSPAMADNITTPFEILVLNSQTQPKDYLCPSDPFLVSKTAAPPSKNARGEYWATPTGPGYFSYSIAYPWSRNITTGKTEAWAIRQNLDRLLPVMSDMAPLNGTGRPKRHVEILPAFSASTRSSGLFAKPPYSEINPFAHGGWGMNVGYSDGHAEWNDRPDGGYTKDNIFTSGGMPGKPPRPGEVEPITTPSSPWDTVMVPLRDGDTGKIR